MNEGIDREAYWMSFLAMTIAQALRTRRDPKKILRPALQRFLQDEPVSRAIRPQIFQVVQQRHLDGR